MIDSFNIALNNSQKDQMEKRMWLKIGSETLLFYCFSICPPCSRCGHCPSFPLMAIKASSQHRSEIPNSFQTLALKTVRAVNAEFALPLLPYGTNMGSTVSLYSMLEIRPAMPKASILTNAQAYPIEVNTHGCVFFSLGSGA